VTEAKDPAQIQREIEQTREQLGDTVEALAQKTDFKTQAKQKLEEAKASVFEKKEQLLGRAGEASPETAVGAASILSRKASENRVPVAIAGVFGAGFLAGRLTKH
jgi:hypothetical protein